MSLASLLLYPGWNRDEFTENRKHWDKWDPSLITAESGTVLEEGSALESSEEWGQCCREREMGVPQMKGLGPVSLSLGQRAWGT